MHLSYIQPVTFSGELLLDQRRFPDSVEKFDEAIRLEKKYTNKKSDDGAMSEEVSEPVAGKRKAYVACSQTQSLRSSTTKDTDPMFCLT
jgi:uncharacterized protein (DUF488 family)